MTERYTLERELGHGGMATVYLAQDLRHGRLIALKVLRQELAPTLGPERFLREIKLAAQLDHPHILPVFDSGEAAGLLWYTMPYVDGESLRDRLRREGQLPLEDAVRLSREVADALDYAHRHRVVHRDVKPENILLGESHARVADFGVARALEAAGMGRVTETGMAVGTPAYMSPEQASGGEVDARSDVYSLGCVLYEMLAGEPPFTGPTPQAILAKRVLEPVPHVRTLRDSVPEPLEQVLTTALARSAADRFQSAGEFAQALSSMSLRQHRPSRRTRVKLALSIGGAGVLLAGYLAARSIESRGPPTLLETGAFSPRERLLLADFGALQVDSGLARVLTELLRIDLAQSPAVTLVPSSQVTEVLGRMGRSTGAKLDPALAREAAVREGIKGVLTGEIARAGSQYVLSAQLVSAADGQVLAAQRETAPDSTVLIAAADRLSKSLRARIGESLKSVARAAPLERVSTRSLEAVRLYTRALQAGDHDNDGKRAIALLQQAIALDSGFAMAYRTMGVYQRNAGMVKAALESFSAALKRRDRLTDRERYLTLGDYHSVLFEPEQAIAAYRSLLESHPDDREALNNLGVLYLILRRPGEAEPMFRRAVEVDSSFWQPRIGLVVSQFLAGKRPEAFSSYRRAIQQRPDDPTIRIWGVAITARSGDYAEAIRLTRELKARHRSDPDVRAMSDASLGELAATQGRITEADGHWRDAMMASVDASSPGEYLFHAINRARVKVLVAGQPDAGLRIVSEALARYPLKQMEPPDRPYLGLAQFYAITGKPGQARRLVLEYQRTIEPWLRRQTTGELELAQGQIALAEHRVADAISLHESAARHGLPMAFGLPELGRAYDLAGQSDSVIAVYRRYLATPDLQAAVPDALYRAAIFQRLGELYESRGDRDQAAELYSRFVELWKDCDPELRPRVAEARRALERLTNEPSS